MRKSIAALLAAAISVNTIVASSSAMYNYNDGADIGITAVAAETMVASNYIISRGVPNVIKLRKRKKVTGTVKVSVTFIMKIFMNRM